MTQYRDADDLLMGGGKGAPGFKFDAIGATVKGIVTLKETMQQRDIKTGVPKTYDDGNPMMQLVVTLQTDLRDDTLDDDDGTRRIFAKGAMLVAIRDAVKEAKLDTLGIGDELTVRYTGDGVAKTRGFNPPKEYRAKVVAGKPLDDLSSPF